MIGWRRALLWFVLAIPAALMVQRIASGEALAMDRKALGNRHPDTLTSTNNLGALLQARGQLDEAQRRALQAASVHLLEPGAAAE